MKTIYKIALASSIALFVSGCGNTEVSTPKVKAETLNERTMCASTHTVAELLATAAKYNTIAKKEGVEFKRLGMTNTQYIDETNKSIKAGSKTVTLLNKKGKATKVKVTVEYAAQRACKFAVSALTQKEEANQTWRLAVPGDGYQY